jgi:hypothetical protein
MALNFLAILCSFFLGSSAFAITIIDAKQVGATPFIKINYTHPGRSLENKFEFILENPENGRESGRYFGRILPIGEQTINTLAITETFLMFKMPENMALPCELVILNEDGSSSFSLEIMNLVQPQIKAAQAKPKKSAKGRWNIF